MSCEQELHYTTKLLHCLLLSVVHTPRSAQEKVWLKHKKHVAQTLRVYMIFYEEKKLH